MELVSMLRIQNMTLTRAQIKSVLNFSCTGKIIISIFIRFGFIGIAAYRNSIHVLSVKKM